MTSIRTPGVRRGVLCAISGVALTLLLSLPSQAQIPIYELSEDALPDIHDGSLADWAHLVPGPSLSTPDFVDWKEGGPMRSGDAI